MERQNSATRRTRVILGHVVSKRHQSCIALQNTAASKPDIVETKVHIDTVKTSEVDFTVMQEDFNFRPYVCGKDDAAFKALDYLCYQGEKTKLISEFPLKHTFESIQSRGGALVAEDYKGDLAGLARSYIYDCQVNGKPSSTSYVFLIRVHPDYRRMSLAIYLTARLFYRDVTETEVHYMTSWVVADNTPSMGLQDRIASVGKEAYGMPECEIIGAYRCIGTYLSNVTKISPVSDNSLIFQHITDPSVCSSVLTSKYGEAQFFPHDTEALFSSVLSLGLYTISARNSDGSLSLLASVCVWNSGEIRVSSFKNSDFRSDGAVLFHNPWFHPSTQGQNAFVQLIQTVSQRLQQEGFKFANLFLPNGGNSPAHDLYMPIIQQLEKDAQINITWKARVWYVRNKVHLDMKAYPEIFYDPRQALI